MAESDRQKWNAKYASGSHGSSTPTPFLVSIAERLPSAGRALDVAGGAGRNALWLAARGLDVTLVDIAQAALTLAEERAREGGLHVTLLERDLATEGLPDGPWDLIVCCHYLERALFDAVPLCLAPGGLFVMVHPTTENLERHERPSRRFLLEPGELGRRLGPHLELLILDESWSTGGFHEARLLARRREPVAALG